jgi:hypothetical protein
VKTLVLLYPQYLLLKGSDREYQFGLEGKAVNM